MAKELDVGRWCDLRPHLDDASLVVVPIPALVAFLVNRRDAKGADLTEDEVLSYRDGAICMVMERSIAERGAQSRGYPDLDLDNVWESWQSFLTQETIGRG